MINPSDIAREMQALRKNKRGGRPKIMRKCKKCGLKLSAREIRAHKCLICP